MVANAWLRPGNTADSSSCKEFLQETIDDVLANKKIGLVRADSGFYTEKILSFLEQKMLNYIIATRLYPNVKSEIYGLDNWLTICDGIEVNQMYFKHENGKKRRYIVVRKQIVIRPKSGGKLLFEDMPGYQYSCFVTKLNLPLDVVWNTYNTRADCENRIKELKQDFGLENFA